MWANRLAQAVHGLEVALRESADLGSTVESLTTVVASLEAASSITHTAQSALDAGAARLLALREKGAQLVLAELLEVLERGSLTAQAVHRALGQEPRFEALAARAQDIGIASDLFCRQLREVVGGSDACGYTFAHSLGDALRDGALPLLHAVATYISEMLASSGAISTSAASIAARLDNPQHLEPRMLVDCYLSHPFGLGPRILALLKRFGGTLSEGHVDLRAIDALLLTLREQEELETRRCAAEAAARQLARQQESAQEEQGRNGRRISWLPSAWRRSGASFGGVLAAGLFRGSAANPLAQQGARKSTAEDVPQRPAPGRAPQELAASHVHARQASALSPERAPRAQAAGSSARRRMSSSSKKRSAALRRHLGFDDLQSKGEASARLSDAASKGKENAGMKATASIALDGPGSGSGERQRRAFNPVQAQAAPLLDDVQELLPRPLPALPPFPASTRSTAVPILTVMVPSDAELAV